LKSDLKKLKQYWKNYFLQSLLAGLAVFALLVLLQMRNIVVVASIGSTAFIVFSMPREITAQARNVIGGHLVGFLCGSLSALIPNSYYFPPALTLSIAVGLSIFIMVVTNTEHPPAAGTALGVAISGFALEILISLLISVMMLSLIHHFFKPHLKHLV
jgi:CBS-domain-containing membrane protein